MEYVGKEFPLDFVARFDLQFYPETLDVVKSDIVEIGPGRGDFLVDMAKAYPDKNFVAVEIGGTRFRKLSARLHRMGLTNVLLIRGDARVVLPKLIPAESVSRLFVLFPDPWPKRRHTHNRLLTPDFIQLLADTIKPGGELFHATDVGAYAEWVVENCRRVECLTLSDPPISKTAPVAEYRPTFFEQKWRAAGKSIHYVLARKR